MNIHDCIDCHFLHCSLVLVFRVGHQSLDLTVVQVINGMYHVLASHSDPKTGGHLIDDVVVEYFASEFQRCGCSFLSFRVYSMQSVALYAGSTSCPSGGKSSVFSYPVLNICFPLPHCLTDRPSSFYSFMYEGNLYSTTAGE